MLVVPVRFLYTIQQKKMSSNSVDIQRVSFVFRFFISFSAERFLESVESNQNYAILLLNLVGKEDLDSTIRVAGSIAFKNFVKRNWSTVCEQFPLDLINLTHS